jgi:hypothetical protein
MYHQIIQDGNFSLASCDAKFKFGPPRTESYTIPIQAAVEVAQWSILFIDHSKLMTFHIMLLREPVNESTMVAESRVFNPIICYDYSLI